MDGEIPIAERTPGVEHQESRADFLSYTAGFVLAVLLTIASFVVARTDLLWPPGIPVGLAVLAFAQIGVHLVFFLHMGTGPDHTNNIIALTYGAWIVFLVIAGSTWIMTNMSWNMMPPLH
jgi:cytochrome o ubiquinol oxidase subunit IV